MRPNPSLHLLAEALCARFRQQVNSNVPRRFAPGNEAGAERGARD
jgi:hypothetical protein